jgi:glycosyltransferase involved in cell wall biosynthesis
VADAGGLLLVVANFDEDGGLQRMYRRLSAALAAERRVTVLTWGRRGPAATDVLPEVPGVSVVRASSLASWNRDQPRGVAAANTAFSVATGLRAALLLRRRWTRVHGAGLNPDGLVAALAARALRRPYSVGAWLPGELGNVARLERSPFRPLHVSLLGRADAYLAENVEIERELVAAGFPSSRIHVVPAGVSTDRFKPADEQRRAAERRRLGFDGSGLVVSCGRFDLRQKRHDLLLEGWRLARLDGWRLVIIGDGPDRARIEGLARGIQPPPSFPGWQRDLRPFFAAADLFAFPTNFEGTGLALMEALASGLPAIVSASPPFARLRPDGAVLVPNDPRSWADALTRLASDEAGRRALAGRARSWVERSFDERRSHDAIRALLS